jgi:hypothetical protein
LLLPIFAFLSSAISLGLTAATRGKPGANVENLQDFLKNCEHQRLAERERDISHDDIVPPELRLAVPVSADAIESLIFHLSDRWDRPKAETLAWDLRRTDADERGWDSLSIMIAAFGSPDECDTASAPAARMHLPTPPLRPGW